MEGVAGSADFAFEGGSGLGFEGSLALNAVELEGDGDGDGELNVEAEVEFKLDGEGEVDGKGTM